MEIETKVENIKIKRALKPKYLFWLRKNKTNQKGFAPIYLRITINGKRKEVATGVSIPEKNWQKSTVTGYTPEMILAQARLKKIIDSLYEAETKSLITGDVYTNSLSIIDSPFSKPIYKPTVLGAFETFIKSKESLIDVDINYKTFGKYTRAYRYFKDFIKQYYKRNDLEFLELKAKTGLDFFHWMRTVKKCGADYSVKIIGVLKALVDFAIIEEYTQTNPLKSLTFKRDKRKEVVFLSVEQLKKLMNINFEANALNIVKDVFIFQCLTGLAYTDLCDFSLEHIQIDASGRTWIKINRNKTGSQSIIPLLSDAQAIIEKYRNIDKSFLPRTKNRGLFPVFSNQVMNRLLKQIGLMIGISPAIMSTHTARKTFATTALNTNGVSIETVSKMLGHAKINITQQYYASVNTSKIALEMQNFKLNTN